MDADGLVALGIILLVILAIVLVAWSIATLATFIVKIYNHEPIGFWDAFWAIVAFIILFGSPIKISMEKD